jgi:Putative lumazine-binding
MDVSGGRIMTRGRTDKERAVTEGAVSPADHDQIVAAATDYVAAWLDADAHRMAGCLHPLLVKRDITDKDGQPGVDEMSRDDMIAATAAGRPRGGEFTVTVLDEYGGIAAVKVVSPRYIDYLHIARVGDRWQLLNVLFQNRVRL